MKTKALIVLSGGQDSATCAWWAKRRYDEIHAVTFDYGQRHAVEIAAAQQIASLVGIASHEIAKVGNILSGTSPLISDAPLEQYTDHGSLPGGLEKTFVPARNLLFLTLAANRAYCAGITTLVTGVCQEDYGGYPDCRIEFIEAFEETLNVGLFTGRDGAPGPLMIETPLMFLTKAETVVMAFREGIEAFKSLAWTHTAYDGGLPDGHDHASLLRAKGFEEANIPDPLVVRAWHDGRMKLPTAANYDVVTWPRDTHTLDTILSNIYGRLISQ